MWKAVSSWLAILFWVAAIIVAAVSLYGSTLSFGYVWDDSLLFIDKTALINESLSWALLSEPVLPGTSYLRPLVFLGMFAEFHFVGQDPAISHGVNVALFSLNCVLIFLVCYVLACIAGRRFQVLPAIVAALLYMVHPALVESTAWISGRFDLQVTTFVLLSVLAYLVAMPHKLLQALLVSALLMGALLSKELGIVVPPVLLCIWMACYGRSGSASLYQLIKRCLYENRWVLVGATVCAVVYLFMRENAKGGIYHSALTWGYLTEAVVAQKRPLEALKLYATLALAPFRSINPLHPLSELTTYSIRSQVGSVVVLIGLVGVLFFALVRRSASAWLFIAALLCIFPVLHFVPLSIVGNLGHERFMAAPMAFFVMAVSLVRYGMLAEFVGLRPIARNAVLTLLAAGWLAISFVTVKSVLPFWAGDLQLWNWVYATHPESKLARYNYLYGALKDGRGELIEKQVAKSIQENGGLDVDEQLLYANYLIRHGNAEGLRYVEGVIYAIPKFHEQPDGRDYIDNFFLTAMQMAGVYVDYANGLLIFEGNAERALEYNKIAAWYLGDSEQVSIQYQRIAILYALGRFEEANKMREEMSLVKSYQKDRQQRGIALLLNHFCGVRGDDYDICSQLLAKGVIEKREVDELRGNGNTVIESSFGASVSSGG